MNIDWFSHQRSIKFWLEKPANIASVVISHFGILNVGAYFLLSRPSNHSLWSVIFWSLRAYDGCCSELPLQNKTLVFYDYFTLVKLYKMSDVSQVGTNKIQVKAENGMFTAPCGLSWEPKFGIFTSSFGRLRKKKMRAARAARLFLPFQPIISLICGVSVNVADVVT